MTRKTTVAWLRMAVLAGGWVVAAAVVQGGAGSELGGSAERLGERLELRLRGKDDKAPPSEPAPTPPHEETVQPWEHVAS
jgi:hypothetical protein